MSNAKFEINLSEEFATLSNAPIVEAVLQFNSPPSIAFKLIELKDLLARAFASSKIKCSTKLVFKARLTEMSRCTTDLNGTVFASTPRKESTFANGNATASSSVDCSLTILGQSF